MEKTKIKIGNDSEKDFLSILNKKGYWAYRCPNTLTGQPCDVIAMKNNNNFLFDVKHCNEDSFVLSRIETNQEDCFDYAVKKKIPCGFAVYFEKYNEWRFWSWEFVKEKKYIDGFKRLSHVNESDMEI